MLPQKKYGAILADPPWRFEVWSKPWEWTDDDGRRKTSRHPEGHYGTMETDGIAALAIRHLAAADCALFLWATMPMLPEALQVMGAWGFKYKTVAFTWVKVLREKPRQPRMGLGYWTRANAELCLLGTRGSPKRRDRGVGQIIAEPPREHSRKPDCTYERIEQLVAGPYLELFARQTWPGWDSWGNEVGVLDQEEQPSLLPPGGT